MKQRLQPGDIEEGLRAAAAIGDDTLQRQTQGRVVPESFTHGSSAQRVRWFTAASRAARCRPATPSVPGSFSAVRVERDAVTDSMPYAPTECGLPPLRPAACSATEMRPPIGCRVAGYVGCRSARRDSRMAVVLRVQAASQMILCACDLVEGSRGRQRRGEGVSELRITRSSICVHDVARVSGSSGRHGAEAQRVSAADRYDLRSGSRMSLRASPSCDGAAPMVPRKPTGMQIVAASHIEACGRWCLQPAMSRTSRSG